MTGIQLYTVRDAMAESVPRTLQAVAGIGYREVEFAGYFDHAPSDIRGLLTRFGLESPSTHMDARMLRDDPGPLVEAAAEIGHRFVTVAWLQPDDRKTIDDYRRWADMLNRLGEQCSGLGMRAAYHNHDFEFAAIDGQVPFEVLVERTDPGLVDFEIDFYWVRKAGRDVLDVLRGAPGRCTMAHIKDFDSDGNIADVGAGTTDFAGILADAAADGIRHAFVEHDSPADPFRSAAFSHFALRKILG